ncbi:MAG: LPXTG cell wall anchor domain-containing protein, partial [Lachnospiraceae bacterium]|nr:LPXTG cell wall anchor domain-containing protein [Lachnospiraceae bacterium]
AGVGSQKDAGGYAALTILGLLLAAGSFFLILAARKKKQHEK